jgi:hypothetical protein
LACGSVSVLVAWFAMTGGCTTNSLVAKGGSCFQSLDCQAGLVCIDANDAGGICTDDLTGIVDVPEAGSDAPAQQDVTVADVTVDQTVPDTSTQDTGTQDTGTQDTGTQDTGVDDGATE